MRYYLLHTSGDHTCIMEPRDGEPDFGTAIEIPGALYKEGCIDACIEKKKSNAAINGVFSSVNEKRCHCYVDMSFASGKELEKDYYQACFLKADTGNCSSVLFFYLLLHVLKG